MRESPFATGNILVDRYQILSYLAAGGMQEVYVCQDLTLNRRVVVKTPKNGVRDRRFKRGAEMGARMNHPNVAATFDYFENEEVTFLVEEFVEGKDLGAQLRERFHYLDPSLAAHVLNHIVRGLFEAHRMGVCHRDLKPSNIMASLDPGLSEIKLTDFGIAKLAEKELGYEIELFGQEASTLTTSQTLLGAVPYMAPECWEDWAAAGKPMDIWAIGCIGYQLLTGRPPFGSGAAAIGAVIRAAQQGRVDLTPPAWFGVHASSLKLEQDFWELICRCFVVDPAARPGIEELKERFDSMCYALELRRSGVVSSYGTASYGRSNSGRISDLNGDTWFFHRTEFFGEGVPTVGQPVSFCVYPGRPWPRSAPVLLVKPHI